MGGEERDLPSDRVFVRREEEVGEGRHGRDHDDQAEEEARDEGREAVCLREGGLREGEARADPCEVLHCEGAEGRILSPNSSTSSGHGSWHGACSWLWGSPAACLSDGRFGHTGRPNI